jgi:hypothetical protein
MTKLSKKFHNRTDARLDMILCLHHAAPPPCAGARLTTACQRRRHCRRYCRRCRRYCRRWDGFALPAASCYGADSMLKSVMHNISTSFALPLLFAILCFNVYILGQ